MPDTVQPDRGPRSNALAEAAAFLAQHWPVFPCRSDKRPATARGFYDASRDEAQVRAMFAQADAALIGVPTGHASDLLVIDVDPDGLAWLAANEHRIPVTRRHETRRGGQHLLFRFPAAEVRNSAGRVSVGVDVRGEGGYVIAPPSPGYAVLEPTMPAEAPAWLIAACAPPPATTAPATPYTGRTEPVSDRYAARALDGECRAVATMAEGGRNDRLNVAAVKLGSLVGAGLLSAETVRAELTAAAHACGLDPMETRKTIASGMAFGVANPRQVPERETPVRLGMFAEVGKTQDENTGGEIPTAPEAPKPNSRALRLMHLEEVEALPPPVWIVDGLVPERSLVIPFGPPKAGKTFIVLSMALHIAAGMDWAGLKVGQGGVVFIAGEGVGGLSIRLKAMRQHYGIPSNIPFWVIPRAVNFREPGTAEMLVKLVRDTVGDEPIALLVVDTLARAMPGVDENSSQEVGVVIAACDAIKEDLGCTVMPIHHTGKDTGKGMRGSNALDGAVDAAFRIEAAGDHRVSLKTEHQKDGEPARPILFQMESVTVGMRSSLVPVVSDHAWTTPAHEDHTELLTQVLLAMGTQREAPLRRISEALGRTSGNGRKELAGAIPTAKENAAEITLGDRVVLLWKQLGATINAPITVCQEDENRGL